MTGDEAWPDAIYTTILDASGAAQPNVEASAIQKVTQVMVTLVGISLIPVLTASIVDAVVGARLAAASGRVRPSTRDHLVVIGLGQVGSRVVGQLHDLGLPMVCIESRPDAPGVALAKRLGVPVIFADVTHPDTLRLASVETSRALLALTSDDVTNLQASLAPGRSGTTSTSSCGCSTRTSPSGSSATSASPARRACHCWRFRRSRQRWSTAW